MITKPHSFFCSKISYSIFGFILIGITLFSFTESFGQNEITIQTDRDSYDAGEVVTINGKATGMLNQQVAIEVKDHAGHVILVRTVKTDSNGDFVLKFRMPSSATAGSMKIIANTGIESNTITTSKEITNTAIQHVVTPEFPLGTFLVVGVLFATVVSFSKWKKLNHSY